MENLKIASFKHVPYTKEAVCKVNREGNQMTITWTRSTSPATPLCHSKGKEKERYIPQINNEPKLHFAIYSLGVVNAPNKSWMQKVRNFFHNIKKRSFKNVLIDTGDGTTYIKVNRTSLLHRFGKDIVPPRTKVISLDTLNLRLQQLINEKQASLDSLQAILNLPEPDRKKNDASDYIFYLKEVLLYHLNVIEHAKDNSFCVEYQDIFENLTFLKLKLENSVMHEYAFSIFNAIKKELNQLHFIVEKPNTRDITAILEAFDDEKQQLVEHLQANNFEFEVQDCALKRFVSENQAQLEKLKELAKLGEETQTHTEMYQQELQALQNKLLTYIEPNSQETNSCHTHTLEYWSLDNSTNMLIPILRDSSDHNCMDFGHAVTCVGILTEHPLGPADFNKYVYIQDIDQNGQYFYYQVNKDSFESKFGPYNEKAFLSLENLTKRMNGFLEERVTLVIKLKEILDLKFKLMNNKYVIRSVYVDPCFDHILKQEYFDPLKKEQHKYSDPILKEILNDVRSFYQEIDTLPKLPKAEVSNETNVHVLEELASPCIDNTNSPKFMELTDNLPEQTEVNQDEQDFLVLEVLDSLCIYNAVMLNFINESLNKSSKRD